MSLKLLVEDGGSRRELLLVGTMVVGRHPACEISSPDPRLSRRHAEISVTLEGVTVRDLQSRNGIRVNGHSVCDARLQPGDIVQVAHLSLQVVPEGPSAPRPSYVGAAETLVIAASAGIVDDDRTRVARPGAFGVDAADGRTTTVRRQVLDERTRSTPAPVSAEALDRSPGVAGVPMTPPLTAPLDAGDVVIRPAARDTGPPAASLSMLGVSTLARAGWGRRVLAHGVLLALLVQLVTLVPVLVWQSQSFGASMLGAWHVLLPALAASVLAGVLVSTMIARLTARGLAAASGAGAPHVG